MERLKLAPLYDVRRKESKELSTFVCKPYSTRKVHGMKSDEVERLIREFIKRNPQYTKNSFSIDLEGIVQVIPGIVRLEDLKEMRIVPSDTRWLADIDEQGNIRVFSRDNVFEKMYFAMLDYRFGKMNFIELLNKWSELLNIKEPPLDIHRPAL